MAQKISRHFSFIGQNIKKIREAKNISQSEFAKLFNLARPSIGAYEEGRSEPKIETLIQISKHFNLSIDVMLTRSLTSKDIFSLGLLNKKLDRAHELDNQPKSRTVPLIKRAEKVNFLVNHHSKLYMEGLPRIEVSSDDIVLVMEHEGNEMELGTPGFKHGDLLFCKESETCKAEQLVCMLSPDGIKTRRVDEVKDDQVVLSAGNPMYEPTTIAKSEIIKVFEVIGVYSIISNPVSTINNRLSKIEGELEKLKLKLSNS
ncbi:MAG: LexA family transcriptional regulator [Bacteroidota bacterium]